MIVFFLLTNTDNTFQCGATVKYNNFMKKFYIETYGCQMNVADSELVVSLLQDKGYKLTENYKESDIILVNTCAVREKAELRVRGKLTLYKNLKKTNPNLKVGLLGCMGQRTKDELLEQEPVLDFIAGPDAYRDLHNLIEKAEIGQRAVNVQLSKEETYGDLKPVRLDKNGVTAFISISRGCDNMCSFCIVPFTRGRERSRSDKSIIDEAKNAFEKGYREVTLLGQNVDKYKFEDVDFAKLLQKVANVSKKLRVRFSTSYPHDFTNKVIQVMADNENICKSIHLPVQSGSTRMLEKMKRGYTREWYMDRISAIKKIIPECAISTDIIAGFCSETDDDHKDTISLMKWANYDTAFMFKYSERPNNYAQRNYADDIPEDVKSERLSEIIELQSNMSYESNKQDLGKTFEVLVEGTSKRSEKRLFGRNSQNKVIIFDGNKKLVGKYVNVTVNKFTQATLLGEMNE